MFKNTSAVQWNHRVLRTCAALNAVHVVGYRLLHPAGRASATSNAMQSLSSTTPKGRGLLALGIGIAVMTQMSLGIVPSLNYVLINLVVSHQLGSLVMLTCGFYAAHLLRYAGQSAVSKIDATNKSVQARITVELWKYVRCSLGITVTSTGTPKLIHVVSLKVYGMRHQNGHGASSTRVKPVKMHLDN